ncbi:hypothetical protein SF1_42280 [Sphingobacterium faecium NBRC 15299]|uniref:hypothetical protein n=1 Tax=Sphingobacterium faecium TaxID=34087 RepID=UPI000D3C5D8A|nr:hypothetical protein [Sphingobacterium faecium]PTX10198.1 hypothetical protein C8N37_105206 [Sphingobacterium faecium]GEM66246.1 hypothetical protein SF1_42280 [Sphingobacterium faecium NBRC 15299]
MLNNREIIIVFLVLSIVIILLILRSTRPLVIEVLKAVFSIKLITIFTLAIIYNIVSIIILSNLGFWNRGLVLESTIWCFFSGLSLIVKILKSEDIVKFFKSIILDHFRILALVEFIIGVYTFSLGYELLLTIFSSTVLIIKLFSEKDPKYIKVTKLMDKLLLILGVILLINILKQLVTDSTTLFNIQNLKKILLPLILTILFSPFIYLTRIYSKYEDSYFVLKRFIKDKQLLQYSFLMAMIHFRCDTKVLERWRIHWLREQPKDKDAISKSINDLKKLIKKEISAPLEIPPNEGWYPYTAKNFLSGQGLETRYYENHTNDKEWYAVSDYKSINLVQVLNNTINYTVLGYANTVKRLELGLMVRDLTEKLQSIETFCLDVSTLCILSLGQDINEKMLTHIINCAEFSIYVSEHHLVTFTCEPLVSPGFYSKFVIEIV